MYNSHSQGQDIESNIYKTVYKTNGICGVLLLKTQDAIFTETIDACEIINLIFLNGYINWGVRETARTELNQDFLREVGKWKRKFK